MNKTLIVLSSVAFIATATSAAAGGTTKGTGGINGVARSGLTSERLGGSTKGTGGMNGVSTSGLSPAARPAQAGLTVLSVTLPAKPAAIGR